MRAQFKLEKPMQNHFQHFETEIALRARLECEKVPDPSHDFLHVLRVVKMAKHLTLQENATMANVKKADLDIVLPAAYLHDVVQISKDDPRRSQASRLSADEASRFLASIGYPEELLPAIAHAIQAHSFSAGIPAETLEACIVQDADRLDGLGAIGIARCFSLSGVLGRTFYQPEDPFVENRPPDDRLQTLDHFYTKLLTLQERLQTSSGRKVGHQRTEYLHSFLHQLKNELL
jgi:uncharacterized protein